MIPYPPKMDLARLPTQLHEIVNISDLLKPGQRIWAKRDDETGCLTTGNKLRKLEFYCHEALELRADTLLTSGSALSNHCRTTAVIARRLGMDCGLLLRGPKEPALDGNFLLMAITGAMFRMIPKDAKATSMDELHDMADRLKSEGKKPYIIPPGGTAELGVIAYAHAALELKTQCDEMGLGPDAAVITVGSGSTHAGLVLGARGHSLGCPVLGVSISAPTEDCEPDARVLITDTCNHLDIDDPTVESDVRILDDYVGGGYGVAGPETYEFIADIGARSGVICDPVYTGKALQGTISEMRSGCLQDAKDVIFVHTGGVFGIYQKKKGFDLENWRTI